MEVLTISGHDPSEARFELLKTSSFRTWDGKGLAE